MAKKLIIVESPTKVHTISQFLGRGYTVRATMGHMIDLPKSKLGIDEENNFEPKYIVMRDKAKTLKLIKESAESADIVYLATDPDREGEAISWHIVNALNEQPKPKKNAKGPVEPKAAKNTKRIVFNEITKKAVLEAIENPRDININLVYAQQARRILDRLVGYKISPLLWKNVQGGLSAGRVQSVALKMICDREKEIEAFKAVEYWSVEADLKHEQGPEFTAKLAQINGKKAEIKNKEEAETIITACKTKDFIVSKIESKEKQKNAPAPFITSTLQQDAARKLGFTSKKTMMIAQQLYEGLNVGEEAEVGLITYMRTDSVRIAAEALTEVRDMIKARYGAEYVPAEPNVYKNRKNSQDAHEAIRPSSALRDPSKIKEYLSGDQFKLYDLIWKRFVASQMKAAIMDVTTVEITAGEYLFRASGNVIKFSGFLSVYEILEEKEETSGENEEEKKEKKLPALQEGIKLELMKITPLQHFTQPPPRYNDATLVKALEENNIGRPSTYSPIISTILERTYVSREEKRFHPTELGRLIDDILFKTFPDILNIEFTAKMEEELDKIEEGTLQWQTAIKDFYTPFKEDLEKAGAIMGSMKKNIDDVSTEKCEKCGKPMVVKWGGHGKFLACTGYPECKSTKSIGGAGAQPEETTTEVCPKCGAKMVFKYGRFGKFLACEKYPECKTTKSIGIGVKCPKEGCGGDVVFRRGKKGAFYGCSKYPACDFITRFKPVARPCSKCKYPVTTEYKGKIKCLNAECKHEEDAPAAK